MDLCICLYLTSLLDGSDMTGKRLTLATCTLKRQANLREGNVEEVMWKAKMVMFFRICGPDEIGVDKLAVPSAGRRDDGSG